LRYQKRRIQSVFGAACVWIGVALTSAQGPAPLSPAALRDMAASRTDSLKTVPVVDGQGFDQFVRDRGALIALGKALFWDQQLGSDGQSCASCHFHAGADNRSKNQLNPGFRAVPPRNAFTPPARANDSLADSDFPFHTPNADNNAIVSSSGVFNATFDLTGFPTTSGVDPGALNPNPTFADGTPSMPVRNVEPRNTPTVVNAVLNHRNFWDSRARNEFNGVNPIGDLDPTAHVVKVGANVAGVPAFVTLELRNNSGASQADGPPVSELEMSFLGRRFADVGRKMLDPNLVALRQQFTAADDSVLGPLSNWPDSGLHLPAAGCDAGDNLYTCLVKQAFLPKWWKASGYAVDLSTGTPAIVSIGKSPLRRPHQFSVMESNFSLFFGMAINEYEKSLISDQAPFDSFMEGNDAALSPSAQNGLRLFLTQGRCINCHSGAEFTAASLTSVRKFEVIERMIMGDDRVAVYDNGHYNTGVRPTTDDLGLGATIGPLNLPLSNARLFQRDLKQLCPDRDAACLRQAGLTAVPRILARPIEAASLLSRGAALLSADNPDRVAAEKLIARATALLTPDPGHPALASCKLAYNPSLGCSTNANGEAIPGALDILMADAFDGSPLRNLLVAAQSLLPDPEFPGSAPKLLAPPLRPDERVAADGAFKTPGLRNVELTAPYFHNGGTSTLEDVVRFYNRGGDFAAANRDNLDVDIVPLGLSEQDVLDIAEFMRALTDSRVRKESAPFDHPSLNIGNGGTPGIFTTLLGFPVLDDRLCIPAAGAAGNSQPLGTPGSPSANFLQPLIGVCQ
jgi:cytochrome c peroxidase